ncbi:MAG TPA: hypothetical protein VFC29_06605 [Candidatus Limnocylindrales bacterium]|nr:hypothetical protein [Candidatus Limnocylindrales bacterium]
MPAVTTPHFLQTYCGSSPLNVVAAAVGSVVPLAARRPARRRR